MNTITLGTTTYVEVEKPLNVFYLRDLGIKWIHPFSVETHTGKDESFEYAHGIIEQEELVSLISKHRRIFIRQSEAEEYKKQAAIALQKVSEIAAYNNF